MINIDRINIIFRNKKLTVLILLLPAIFFSRCHNKQQTWSVYKADAESTSYSLLKQINKENVHQLTLAWTFNPNDAA